MTSVFIPRVPILAPFLAKSPKDLDAKKKHTIVAGNPTRPIRIPSLISIRLFQMIYDAPVVIESCTLQKTSMHLEDP
jgi:hypothetical protein